MGKKRKLSDMELIENTEMKRTLKKSKPIEKSKVKGETFEDKLARSDPEFLKFLKEEGSSDLLECSADDMSETSSDESLEPTDEEDNNVASDDDNDVKKKKAKKTDVSKLPSRKRSLVTVKMVQHWSQVLKEKASVGAMCELIEAFKAALQQTGKGTSDDDNSCKFKVVGSAEFNAVIQTCIQDLVPALLQHLKLPVSKDPNKPTLPSASPRWKKIHLSVKCYLADVIQLLTCVGSADVVRSLLKHILDLVVFFLHFPKLKKLLLKKLIEVWSENESEKNRIVAFCAIHRLLRLNPDSLLERAFKSLYTAYVRNTKFTSPTTLPMIQLMKRSLVEIARIDINLSYKYAFVYIRQLAIHLRNAINVQKKETTQAVYNWQFIHSLSLWTELVSELCSDESVKSLVYPLTQIIIGTIKLVPTAQFYPLRFLCVRELNKLSSMTSTFIPVLPFLTEILEQVDCERKVHGTNIKPFNFLCILKLSKAQLHTKAFRDGVIDEVYELMFEYLNVHSHSVGFPELALHAVLQLRKFVKSCKVPAYTRKMKELLSKITETSTAINDRRRIAALNLQDGKAVAAWESKSNEAGTPLSKFYTTWKKLRDQQLKTEVALRKPDSQQKDKKISNNIDDLDDDELEMLAQSASSGSEDESQDEGNNELTRTVSKKNTMSQQKDKREKTADTHVTEEEEDEDIVESMTLSDSDGNDDDDN
jgi:nucleolar complex protein 2